MAKLAGIFALGGLQGFIGWYMVRSGLADRVDVSQYRLALHLSLAVAIFGAAAVGGALARPARPHAGRAATAAAAAGRGRRHRRPGVPADRGRGVRGRAQGGRRLQHLAADGGAADPAGPRRHVALVGQPVRERAHRAVQPPPAGLRHRARRCSGTCGRCCAAHAGRLGCELQGWSSPAPCWPRSRSASGPCSRTCRSRWRSRTRPAPSPCSAWRCGIGTGCGTRRSSAERRPQPSTLRCVSAQIALRTYTLAASLTACGPILSGYIDTSILSG